MLARGAGGSGGQKGQREQGGGPETTALGKGQQNARSSACCGRKRKGGMAEEGGDGKGDSGVVFSLLPRAAVHDRFLKQQHPRPLVFVGETWEAF